MNDVNTIFYFYPNSKTEYEADWNDGKINPRTIVFIASTGEIYKGGIRYGGMTLSEVRTQTTTIVNENQFDPSSILNSISTLLGLINGLNTRISGIMTEKQEELTGIIGDVLSEYVTLKKTYSGLFQEQGFTDALDTYLLRIGNVTTGSAIWSTYDLRINSITTRVTSVEEALGYLTETRIKQWIDNGVAGINLSTFLTSEDIEGLIKLNDLKASGVLDDLLTNFSTAFINLKTKAEGSEAVIGAWDRSTMGGTIKDLFSALSILVNNIESSVTTSLSSTVNRYLQDSALPNYISGYLSNLAGLVLESNLASSVAALFSSSLLVLDGVTGYLNTAGYLTETSADGALATIIAKQTVAPENEKVYYCEGIDTSETAATFNAVSGQSVAEGYYYSATDLATVCGSSAAIIIGTPSPFLILGTDSKKYKLAKVSSVEAALAQSNIFASIQVGAANNQSFIDMIADNITINADRIDLNGDTWANILHVNELVVNSLKDADGNSVLVSYLVDKMQENSTYTIEVLNLIPGISSLSSIGIRYYCNTEFALGEANTGTVLIAGHSAHFKLESPASISLVGHVKITMGGRDITSKYTTYGLDYDGYPVNVIDVNIPCVTGNIVVTISGKSDIGHREYGLPRIVNINGKSSDIALTADVFSNVTYVHTSGNNTYHYVDEVTDWNVIDPSDSQAKKSYGGITISNGTASASTGVSSATNVYKTPTITITPGSVSANDVITIAGTWISGTTTGDAIFSITIVDNASFPDYYYVDFDVTNNGALPVLPDFSKAFITREDNITSQTYVLAEKTNSSIANITFSIDASYNDYAMIITASSILYLRALRHAMVPITMNVTLTGLVNGVDYIAEVTRWVCIKPKLFSSSNTTADVYLDIYGNSDRDLQFVSNDHTVGGVPIFTKYISYDRNSNTDYNYVYLCEEATDNPSITLDQTTGNEPPSWISTSDISLIVYNGKRYLVFKASNNSDALTHYNGLSHRITIEDQQVGRAGYINLNAADGSTCKIYVMQSGNLGFYDVLKDTVHNCVSPYYLTPKYHWKRIMWKYNASSDSIIKTDLYPNAILIPSAGWKAVVSSATSGAFGSDNNTEATMEYNPSNTNFDAFAIFDL